MDIPDVEEAGSETKLVEEKVLVFSEQQDTL